MAFQLKFADQIIDEVALWTEHGGLRVEPDIFPRRHEAILPDMAMLAPKRIVVSGEVHKANLAASIAYLRALFGKLVELGQDKLYLYDDGTYLKAICRDWGVDREAGRAPDVSARFTIAFDAQPFFFGADQSQTEANKIPPWNFTVTNNGGVRTPVTLEVTATSGDLSNIKLTNTTTGLFVYFTGTLLAGNTLIFDNARTSKRMTVQNGGGNSLNN